MIERAAPSSKGQDFPAAGYCRVSNLVQELKEELVKKSFTFPDSKSPPSRKGYSGGAGSAGDPGERPVSFYMDPTRICPGNESSTANKIYTVLHAVNLRLVWIRRCLSAHFGNMFQVAISHGQPWQLKRALKLLQKVRKP
ncbi:UNVERIFIED_CONTAM: hypothetical protein Sradi_0137600 [Sesamum radiatum]|uniref:Uncharacterized protein n=1 Tax=Sesamum radiatum TaxID=300843 RepID=A0AAW2WJM8_SESRA